MVARGQRWIGLGDLKVRDDYVIDRVLISGGWLEGLTGNMYSTLRDIKKIPGARDTKRGSKGK